MMKKITRTEKWFREQNFKSYNDGYNQGRENGYEEGENKGFSDGFRIGLALLFIVASIMLIISWLNYTPNEIAYENAVKAYDFGYSQGYTIGMENVTNHYLLNNPLNSNYVQTRFKINESIFGRCIFYYSEYLTSVSCR